MISFSRTAGLVVLCGLFFTFSACVGGKRMDGQVNAPAPLAESTEEQAPSIANYQVYITLKDNDESLPALQKELPAGAKVVAIHSNHALIRSNEVVKADFLKKLATLPSVESVAEDLPSRLRESSPKSLPKKHRKPAGSSQCALTPACSTNHISRSWATEAMDIDLMIDALASYRQPQVTTKVYVIDTGFDVSGGSAAWMSRPIKVESALDGPNGKPAVDNDGKPLIGDLTRDENGHGTATASAVGAKDFGTSPNSDVTELRIMPPKGTDTGSEVTDSMLFLAMAKACDDSHRDTDPGGVTILSVSWGDRWDEGGFKRDQQGNVIRVEQLHAKELDALAQRGCFVSVAAGNANFRNKFSDSLDDNYERAESSDIGGELSYFSSLGRVRAPGNSVVLLSSQTATEKVSDDKRCDRSDKSTRLISGTSFSTPYAAGIAAEIVGVLKSGSSFSKLDPKARIRLVTNILSASSIGGIINGLRAVEVAHAWSNSSTGVDDLVRAPAGQYPEQLVALLTEVEHDYCTKPAPSCSATQACTDQRSCLREERRWLALCPRSGAAAGTAKNILDLTLADRQVDWSLKYSSILDSLPSATQEDQATYGSKVFSALLSSIDATQAQAIVGDTADASNAPPKYAPVDIKVFAEPKLFQKPWFAEAQKFTDRSGQRRYTDTQIRNLPKALLAFLNFSQSEYDFWKQGDHDDQGEYVDFVADKILSYLKTVETKNTDLGIGLQTLDNFAGRTSNDPRQQARLNNLSAQFDLNGSSRWATHFIDHAELAGDSARDSVLNTIRMILDSYRTRNAFEMSEARGGEAIKSVLAKLLPIAAKIVGVQAVQDCLKQYFDQYFADQNQGIFGSLLPHANATQNRFNPSRYVAAVEWIDFARKEPSISAILGPVLGFIEDSTWNGVDRFNNRYHATDLLSEPVIFEEYGVRPYFYRFFDTRTNELTPLATGNLDVAPVKLQYLLERTDALEPSIRLNLAQRVLIRSVVQGLGWGDADNGLLSDAITQLKPLYESNDPEISHVIFEAFRDGIDAIGVQYLSDSSGLTVPHEKGITLVAQKRLQSAWTTPPDRLVTKDSSTEPIGQAYRLWRAMQLLDSESAHPPSGQFSLFALPTGADVPRLSRLDPPSGSAVRVGPVSVAMAFEKFVLLGANLASNGALGGPTRILGRELLHNASGYQGMDLAKKYPFSMQGRTTLQNRYETLKAGTDSSSKDAAKYLSALLGTH